MTKNPVSKATKTISAAVTMAFIAASSSHKVVSVRHGYATHWITVLIAHIELLFLLGSALYAEETPVTLASIVDAQQTEIGVDVAIKLPL
jgi:hypothetical protein